MRPDPLPIGLTAPSADLEWEAPDGAAAVPPRAFELLLLEQLALVLVGTTEEGDEASAASVAYRDLLPAALTDVLERHGGLGSTGEPGPGSRRGEAP